MFLEKIEAMQSLKKKRKLKKKQARFEENSKELLKIESVFKL